MNISSKTDDNLLFYFIFLEKATSEKNIQEPWDVILTICDKIKINGSPKEALRSIMKRLGHSDPHVVVQAITVSKLISKYNS